MSCNCKEKPVYTVQTLADLEHIVASLDGAADYHFKRIDVKISNVESTVKISLILSAISVALVLLKFLS